jgi:wyosine [tRNA(Phe)-imidazoG37] synthetase (radical SAM superfamily)
MERDAQPPQIVGLIQSGPAEPPSITFGPVPSRRLGRSLGINNIPPKICSYSCVYCQVGPTLQHVVTPRDFYSPPQIRAGVTARVEQLRAAGEAIDHLTFVPDGEPTLDAGLGESIRLLRPLGIDVAVISNGSLLWRRDVRCALDRADWVSVKVDAATETTWHRVNKPHTGLDLATVRDGIQRFAEEFTGELVSETMLIEGVNDDTDSLVAVARFLSDIRFDTAYLAIPTRPTPYPGVTAPDEEAITRASRILSDYVPRVVHLIGYEGDEFAATGDLTTDLLAITAVHPMRASAVAELLERTGGDWKTVEDLVDDGKLAEVTYRDQQYYVRRWR